MADPRRVLIRLYARVNRRWAAVLERMARMDWDEGAVLLVFGVAIGIAAGLSVVVFYRLIDLSHTFFINWLGAQLDIVQLAFYRPVLTALGIWAAWFLVVRTRIPDGQNLADVQLAVAKRNGTIHSRPVAVRTLAAAMTLGSGGSAGSEGPVAVLGSAVGSSVGRFLRFHPRRVKILVGCGAAAGISGAFNAPLAGAFFALEQVLGSFSIGAFSPVVVASVAGALTVRPFLGSSPSIRIPTFEDVSITGMLLYPLLGIACGLVSILFVRSYFAASDAFKRMRGPVALRPVLGGLAVGAVSLMYGGILVGDGHLAIPATLFGEMAWHALLVITLAKIFATVVTLNCGGSGGVFTPTLFVGAALGGSLGRLAADVLPQLGVHPQTWGVVGMAGLVAGATRAPLTAMFMVFELTNDYTVVLPAMVVTAIAYLFARRYSAYGLYDGWLVRRGEHLAHGADRAVMDRIAAGEAIDRRAVVVRPGDTLAAVIAASGRTRHTTLPVVDDDGTLQGVIPYHALRQTLLDRGELSSILLAADLVEPTETITPEQSLRIALATMNARALDTLPVVESTAVPRFLGVLTRADVLAAYERELMHQV